MRSVGIVGLGLMGGSLARDLHSAGWRVLAAERDPDTLAAARAAGVVAGPLHEEAAHGLDLIVLALPVRAATEWVRSLAGVADAGSSLVITDVGSTKRSILAATDAAGLGPKFVGSHPMAGSHESGWAAARADLFRGHRVWICPTAASRPAAVAAVEQLWRDVGAEPQRTDPLAHDRLMALASHLPQLTATALAGLLSRHDVSPADLGPGGRDATRLAGSDPDMWTDILLDNSDQIAPALDALARELAQLAGDIRTGHPGPVRRRMEKGRVWTGEPRSGGER